MPPRGLLHGLGNMARHIPGPFVRPMLHYQDEVVVLLQDDPEMDGGEGPPHYQLPSELAVHPAEVPERMPVIRRIPNCCRCGLPLSALASISSGATSTLSV